MANRGKPIQLEWNSAGGINLLTERDSGNLIGILTGYKERSIAYFRRLRNACNKALTLMGVNAKETPDDNLLDALRRAESALTWYVEDKGEADVDALAAIRKELKEWDFSA